MRITGYKLKTLRGASKAKANQNGVAIAKLQGAEGRERPLSLEQISTLSNRFKQFVKMLLLN